MNGAYLLSKNPISSQTLPLAPDFNSYGIDQLKGRMVGDQYFVNHLLLPTSIAHWHALTSENTLKLLRYSCCLLVLLPQPRKMVIIYSLHFQHVTVSRAMEVNRLKTIFFMNFYRSFQKMHACPKP